MDLGSLRTLAFGLNLSAHGVPATLTPPNQPAVTTRVIWATPETQLEPPGAQFGRREPIRIAVISRSDVPSVPRGTLILAPESAGGSDQLWRVDGMERVEADHHRVIVVAV